MRKIGLNLINKFLLLVILASIGIKHWKLKNKALTATLSILK